MKRCFFANNLDKEENYWQIIIAAILRTIYTKKETASGCNIAAILRTIYTKKETASGCKIAVNMRTT